MGKRNNKSIMLKKNNLFILYFLTFFVFFGFSSYAQIVDKVIVKGNARVSTETILLYGKVNLDEKLNEKKINDILNNLNSTNFFEDIKVEIKNNNLIII